MHFEVRQLVLIKMQKKYITNAPIKKVTKSMHGMDNTFLYIYYLWIVQ